MAFDFENFPVYKASLDFAKEIDELINSINSKIYNKIIDQISRASLSIALNIAEGAGRFHKSDKRNFYVMARGSVYESVACIQILLQRKLLGKEQYDKFYNELNNLAKQLSAMIK